jgi:hypothetical protein
MIVISKRYLKLSLLLPVYLTLSRLFPVMMTHLLPYVPQILRFIQDTLTIRTKNYSQSIEDPLLHTLHSMIHTLGSELPELQWDLVALVFKTKLSITMYKTLIELSRSLPDTFPVIQSNSIVFWILGDYDGYS